MSTEQTTICDRSDCQRLAYPDEAFCCIRCERGDGTHDPNCHADEES